MVYKRIQVPIVQDNEYENILMINNSVALNERNIDFFILNPFDLMGEEDIFMQNKTRTLNAICSGSTGELMKITFKDFK